MTTLPEAISPEMQAVLEAARPVVDALASLARRRPEPHVVVVTALSDLLGCGLAMILSTFGIGVGAGERAARGNATSASFCALAPARLLAILIADADLPAAIRLLVQAGTVQVLIAADNQFGVVTLDPVVN